ncbi:MAG: hypothetical protein QOE30_5001 [Mycobacterium sp.]|jgi:hypothetical protein|uniref:hypothetical protein n=1 Tax=Mycobacterium sp. TaxID=1785 RepID=UPI0028BD102F|nr:hypothetical protein [Mycobacterium sp.]MDT5119262.1 hypothetical protein [Mycobacterium sp.]
MSDDDCGQKPPDMIWIYLTDAYPTEADCRASVNTMDVAMDVDAEYLGVWLAPTRAEVHVFSAGVDAEELAHAGWERA